MPEIQFKTLENTSVAELIHVFNEAFSDYIVPFHLSKEQLVNKIVSESIRREFSIGAFEDNQLTGFILHGIDLVDGQKIAYNAGTGVIPSKRGNKLTARLYEHVLPLLKKEKISKVKLEVISNNLIAKNTYEKIGFAKTRKLDCYKGKLNSTPLQLTSSVRHIYDPDWQVFSTFWDWAPTWQNSITAINNSWSLVDTIGIYSGDELAGYSVYNPSSKKIYQFAINKKYRRNGFGKQLFQYINENIGHELSLTNVDNQSSETENFLSSIGFNKFITQEEMELVLG